MENNDYQLLDSGDGLKLESLGLHTVIRPASQAVWTPQLSKNVWQSASLVFSRENEKRWTFKKGRVEPWQINVSGICFKIQPTDFGHLGIFAEQSSNWLWIQEMIAKCHYRPKVLNLFAYSGGSTLAAAKAGAEVTHVDSSKGMVAWARDNAEINQLQKSPIRWIVEDVKKFLKRQVRRGSFYDAIILDPPSFGRGSKGEVFKIEEDIISLLELCFQVLSKKPLFVLLSCHSPGFTPTVLEHLLKKMMKDKRGLIDQGEMFLTGHHNAYPLPSGSFARWYCAE